uniref:At1g61320/AtMIF1 LRR domain-containing protein n=1 Tax=Oryza meridionalis TaxID=40149 RepID=A0A0E0E7N6_9ORYZ
MEDRWVQEPKAMRDHAPSTSLLTAGFACSPSTKHGSPSAVGERDATQEDGELQLLFSLSLFPLEVAMAPQIHPFCVQTAPPHRCPLHGRLLPPQNGPAASAPPAAACKIPASDNLVVRRLRRLQGQVYYQTTGKIFGVPEKAWCLDFIQCFQCIIISKDVGLPMRLNKELFIERVDSVLKQRSGLGVQTMAILYELENEDADHIDRWLNFVIASKTKQLILDLDPYYPKVAPYNFPFKLFNATNSLQLQALKLISVSLKLPANFMGFRNLQKLKLDCTDISDDDMQTLVSNCNALNFLGILYCGMLTRLQTSQPLNQLKHLQVENCTMLQDIQLNFGLTKLEYEGPLIPLAPPGPLLMTNVMMKLSDIDSALEYIFTKLPSTLPRLETLTVNCSELKRATLPEKTVKFMYLKHLRLELTFCVRPREADMFDFACILKAAPLLEILELHMWMPYDNQHYCEDHGVLRSLPNHAHSNLKFAYVTGFYGMKDQLELLRHILINSVMLDAMKIDPRPVVAVPHGTSCHGIAKQTTAMFLMFMKSCLRMFKSVNMRLRRIVGFKSRKLCY